MLTLSPTAPYPVASGVRPVLRYPGGKQRAVRILADYIPRGESELCSPFLGGGSFELHCATHLGMQVHAYDNFRPLVEFWNALLSQPAKLAAEAARFLPNIPRAEFYRLQKEQGKLPRQLERAGAFYVINRASFSGCTLSGGMSPGHPRFTVSAVERVRQFPGKMVAQKMKVRRADFSESIAAHPKALIYADPPTCWKTESLRRPRRQTRGIRPRRIVRNPASTRGTLAALPTTTAPPSATCIADGRFSFRIGVRNEPQQIQPRNSDSFRRTRGGLERFATGDGMSGKQNKNGNAFEFALANCLACAVGVEVKPRELKALSADKTADKARDDFSTSPPNSAAGWRKPPKPRFRTL